MDADGTSRDALIERVSAAIHAEKRCPCDLPHAHGCNYNGIAAEWAVAAAVVDAVVMPLVQSRDTWCGPDGR